MVAIAVSVKTGLCKKLKFEGTGKTTIADLQKVIHKEEGVEVANQKLLFNKEHLKDTTKTFEDSGIANGSVLQLAAPAGQYTAIFSQMFNALACFALGGVYIWFEASGQSDWHVTLLFSAVLSIFWGFVYMAFACCYGDFSLTVGTILGMCVGPVAIFAGALLNELIPSFGQGWNNEATVYGWYGYSMMIFGFVVFVVNFYANLQYRTAFLGCGSPCGSYENLKDQPLLSA